jgi:glycosyltransferase involved in cell wall biosynthesis
VRISVVVPAYNEARLIARTLSSIPPLVSHVVVVDDASQDDTAARALALDDGRVQVIRHAHNRGVGAAIVSGYEAAFAAGADVCVVMAGDGQMDPADLPRLVAPVLRGDAVYAKGDRLSYWGARRAMPVTRWLGNLVLARLTGWAVGFSVRDSQCGYTALSRDGAKQLPLAKLWQRYGYPNDLLGMLSERDLPVCEVVVRPVYADEESGIRLWHALFVVPFVLLRVFLRRGHYALSRSRAKPRASGFGSRAEPRASTPRAHAERGSLLDVSQVTAELP